MAEYQALLDTYLNHGLGLAAKNPTAEETADLLLWAISRGNGTPAGDKARQMFVDHFADTDRVADLLMPAMYRPSPDDAALAERVLQINADHKSQAFATMLLAKHKVAMEEFDGAEELLERIIDEFGDVRCSWHAAGRDGPRRTVRAAKSPHRHDRAGHHGRRYRWHGIPPQ